MVTSRSPRRMASSAPTRLLTLALVVTFLLFLSASLLSVRAVTKSLADAGELARREEQTAYRVTEISRGVPELHASALEAATGSARAGDHRLVRAHAIRRELDRARADLEPLLGADELAVWLLLQPFLDLILGGLDAAIAAIEHGDATTATQLLGQMATASLHLEAELDRFESVSTRETELAVRGIETDAVRTAWIAFFSAFGVVAAVGLVWLFILRIVRAQRRELATYLSSLEDSNRDLDAFAGRVAHDLRNVLAPVSIGAEIILESPNDAQVERVAKRIRSSCKRGETLIEGLLAFARSTAEPSAAAPASASIAGELSEVLEQLDEAILRVGVAVTTTVPTEALVAMPRPLLSVVLTNVIDNAVKYMEGCQERRLGVTAVPSRAGWSIVIEDTGPGIPAHDLPRVFDPYFRSRPGKRRGVGLGLATVKRIVDAHHGRISLTSTEQRGTTVTLDLARPARASLTAAPELLAAPRRT